MSYYAACALIQLPVMSDYPAFEEMYYPLCSSSPAHLPLMKGFSKKRKKKRFLDSTDSVQLQLSNCECSPLGGDMTSTRYVQD